MLMVGNVSTVNPEMLANIIFTDFVFLDFLATTNFNILISNKINNETSILPLLPYSQAYLAIFTLTSES